MTGMLLADHGARVTKIEPPGGDPTRAFSGAQVWHRGKRSAVLDLARRRRPRPVPRARVARRRARRELSRPATTTALGIDYDTLHALQPAPRRTARSRRTATTAGTPDRPGLDALVAARTGHQWESRGVPGGTLARLAGVPPAFPDLVVPDDCWVAAPRPGPLFSGVPWVSMASCYLATLAISAALRVREQTGRGQRVSTSLLQGVLATTLSAWQRVEHADTENFQSWIIDPRAPKGVFRCADGRWVHQWVPLPDFVLQRGRGRPRAAHREDHAAARRDHAHRDGRQRDAAAAPLPAAHGGRDRQVPVGTVGRARRRGRRAAPADPLARGGAARRRVRGRRLRDRGRRSRARPGAPGRPGVRAARLPDRRAHRAAGASAPHTDDGARRSRRARAPAAGAARHVDTRHRRHRSPACGCSTSGSRSRDRGAR